MSTSGMRETMARCDFCGLTREVEKLEEFTAGINWNMLCRDREFCGEWRVKVRAYLEALKKEKRK